MESYAPLSIGYTRCAPDYMQEGFVDKYAIVYSYIYMYVFQFCYQEHLIFGIFPMNVYNGFL